MVQRRLPYFRQPDNGARLHAIYAFNMKALVAKGAGAGVVVGPGRLVALADEINFLIFS